MLGILEKPRSRYRQSGMFSLISRYLESNLRQEVFRRQTSLRLPPMITGSENTSAAIYEKPTMVNFQPQLRLSPGLSFQRRKTRRRKV